MKTTLTIVAIVMFAAMLGISAFAPALADKETAPGQKKVSICHYDEDEDKYVQITISAKAAESHKKNHPMDKDVDPETGCEIIQPPTDTDGDGVSDELDLCPDTPLGVVVDGTGCEIIQPPTDTDGDGVSDELDLCPDTPLGVAVDVTGCEIIGTIP